MGGQNCGMINRVVGAALAIVVGLTFAHPCAAANGERDRLLEQERALERRIGTLRQEQDFLLFQQTMYRADSKYLVLNLSKMSGQLRYKNRVLKDFRFLMNRNRSRYLKRGPVAMTGKVEASGHRVALMFGKTLILWPKPSPGVADAAVPHMVLFRKDFRSVYSALENGALAYILR